jgi:hypothetical protein
MFSPHTDSSCSTQVEMRGQIFRIAHLGLFDFFDTIALIGALK